MVALAGRPASTAQLIPALACRHLSLESLSERTLFLSSSAVDNDHDDEDNERTRLSHFCHASCGPRLRHDPGSGVRGWAVV